MPTRNIPTRRRRAIVGGVAVALLGAGIASAAVASAAPAVDCPPNIPIEYWHGVTLTGVQYNSRTPTDGRQTRYTFNADSSVDWSVAGVGDRTYRDTYSQSGSNSVRFYSDLNSGRGYPIAFYVSAEQCDASGHVTQASAQTQVPLWPDGSAWYTLQTNPGQSLRSNPSADAGVE
jgi:hypothetical protein